jgi:hypothetical protein
VLRAAPLLRELAANRVREPDPFENCTRPHAGRGASADDFSGTLVSADESRGKQSLGSRIVKT